jgi:hypothetical protein
VNPKTGDVLRVVPMILWVALIGGGIAYLTLYRPMPTMLHNIKADRDLPQNTLLLSDMLITEWTGRYLVKPGGVKAGEAIQDSDVANEPTLPAPPPARFLLVIPVPLTTVGPINAGSKVQLCSDASLAATVLFVHCEGKINPACAATVELPTDSLKSLADHAATIKTLRVADSCN